MSEGGRGRRVGGRDREVEGMERGREEAGKEVGKRKVGR